MLKNRFKSLLCYILILMLLISTLVNSNITSALALTPGEAVKELTLVPGQTLCLDTRYNYKIKKSNFIEYIEYYGNSNYLYKCENSYQGDNSDNLINADAIDWGTITEYAIYSYDQPGYGFYYNSDSSSVIKATEEGEYLVFSFYSEYGAKIFIDYITNSPKYAIYDTYDGNNRVVLGMYHCQADGLFSAFDETDDVDFRVVTDWNKGDVVKPNEVIIDYSTQYVKVVANQVPSLDLTNTCTIKRGQAHYGVSGMGDTFYFQFDDTYPTYTYINSDYGDIMNDYGYTEWKEYRIFGVDLPADSIYYLDYFTGDLVYQDTLAVGTTPTIYEDTTGKYPVFINSETGSKLKESDLKGGLIVYCMPSEIDTTIYDMVYSKDEDTKFKITADSNLNNLSTIEYELLRTSLFNTSDYPFLYPMEDGAAKFDLYRQMILTAEELKPVYDCKIHAIHNKHEATLFDGETGNAIITNSPIDWTLEKINNKDLSEFGNSIKDTDTSNIIYTLSMSDADKGAYPHIFSASELYLEQRVFERYNNQKFSYKDIVANNYYVSKLINAKATTDSPTCTDKGEAIYEIAYDFCNNYGIRYFLKDTFTYIENSNINIDFDRITDSNFTSKLTYIESIGDNVSLVLSHIENFDVFANPYLLDKYNIKQYETLYLYANYDAPLIEIYPSYSNNKLYYNVCYQNDFTAKNYYISEWDNVLSFEDSAEGIAAYNLWLDSLDNYGKDKHIIMFDHYYNGTKIITANRNNPLDTATPEILKNTYNAVKFNLTGIDDESDSVTSVFFKSDANDGIYLKTLYLDGSSPHRETNSIDELGHLWGNNWIAISDVNSTSSYTAITAINNSVVDLDSLLANAENEIDKTLLNDSNNKLYYRICSRMQDAYELKVEHTHKYGKPTFIWSEDYESCKAEFKCTSGDDTEVLDCMVSKSGTQETCTQPGELNYIAKVTFEGNNYSDSKTKIIPNTGHTYGKPEFIWSDDYENCKAKFTCIRNDDTQFVDCTIKQKITEATCTEAGVTEYVASATFGDQLYTDTKTKDIEALGHKFGDWYTVKEPTYFEDGLQHRDCIRKDKTETRAIPKNTKVAVVDGYLRDDNGNPIKNSKVEMHSDPMYTYTDENGYFKFEDVEIGNHTLKVFNSENNMICEFAIDVNIVESAVKDNYVSDRYKWDSTINESNVSLNIDGIKIDVPEKDPPQTGDTSNIHIYMILCLLSLACFIGALATRKNK